MREKAKHEDKKEEERVRQRKHYICYRGQEVKTERERQATLLNRINRMAQICYRVGEKHLCTSQSSAAVKKCVRDGVRHVCTMCVL